jgi:transposase
MQKISTMRTSKKNIFQGQLTIGVDLGDRFSAYCVLNESGEIVLEHKVATTPEAMKQVFGSMPRCRIAMETGTHSPWVSRLLTALGHEVIVAHAQKVRLITKSRRKDDRLDARSLARLARIDPELLSPVKHRSAQAQLHLTEIRARAVLGSARTALVNAARGLVKSYGERLRKCGTEQFRRDTTSGLSAGLREALEPLLQELESLNERIQEYDRRIEQMSKKTYPETVLLKQIKGVGNLIATTYVLTLEDPHRFRKSRDAGCFVGLQPGRRNSGESEPQMRVSKEGDEYLRTLLVQGAHYILGPFGEDSDLRRWGESSRREEGKPPRRGRWWRWRASWRYCCTGCG